MLKKVVAVVKIVAFTGLIIAAAALTIAATVVTGGAADSRRDRDGARGGQKNLRHPNKAWPTRAKAAVANPAPEQGAFTGLIGKFQFFANSPVVADISDALSIIAGGASAAKKRA